jgi:hypothetical protein
MKQIVSIFRAALLIAVLASLAACSGSFIDPGHVDGIVSMGGGDFGGDYSGGGGGGGDDEGGGGGGSNISTLSSGASYSQANAKLDEIIAYCNAHPGNDMVKSGAQALKSSMSAGWDLTGSTYYINIINGYIDTLE